VRGAPGARGGPGPDRRDALTVSGLFRIPLAELAAVHRDPLPSLFS